MSSDPQRESFDEMDRRIAAEVRAEEIEEGILPMSSDHGPRLRAQQFALVEKWRLIAEGYATSEGQSADYGHVLALRSCADELDALLRASASAPLMQRDFDETVDLAFEVCKVLKCAMPGAEGYLSGVLQQERRDERRRASASALPPERKPFTLNVTKEWIERMAALEEEHGGEIGAGSFALPSALPEKEQNMSNDIPRRNRMDQWGPAERAIYDAVQAVEAMAADVRLTDAVILLQAARDSVADYTDNMWPCRRYVHTQPVPSSSALSPEPPDTEQP